LSKNKKAILP